MSMLLVNVQPKPQKQLLEKDALICSFVDPGFYRHAISADQRALTLMAARGIVVRSVPPCDSTFAFS
jgi:hypothetical protein